MFLHSDLSMHEGFGEFPKENFVHGWVVGFQVMPSPNTKRQR